MLRSALPALALIALPALAAGQTPLDTFDGQRRGFHLGSSVASAGDFDADGFEDVIAGAPFANPSSDPNTFQLGQALVFSGFDGSILFSLQGDQVEEFLGSSVASAGDADGDGFGDVVIGAPGASLGGARTGVVRIFSGATGSLLFAMAGDPGSQLGEVVASAGDVDGDGRGDVVAGAPRAVQLQGSVRVFSGATGALLHDFVGAGQDDFFGRAVAGAGDVDADGFADIVASAPSNKLGSGYTRVFSGATGALLHDIPGDPRAVSAAGDVNADGFDDFAVGEPFRLDGSRVRIHSGADASVLFQFDEPTPLTAFGISVQAAGDINADGSPDLVVGAQGHTLGTTGFVTVFSGADGRPLQRIEGIFDEHFGASVAAADTNADGFSDLIVGAPRSDAGGADTGRVLIFSGSEAVGTPFCPSLPNSSGSSSTLSARGSGAAQPLNLTLGAAGTPGATQGIFFFGPMALAGTPFGDGLRCVGGPTLRILPPVQGANGLLSTTLDPGATYASAITSGADLSFQCWFRDAAGMQAGFNTSGGLRILFR